MQEEVKYELINMDSTAAIARWLPQQLFQPQVLYKVSL